MHNWRLDNPPVVERGRVPRMGLFVVGRLAARHGVRVLLRPVGRRPDALIWLGRDSGSLRLSRAAARPAPPVRCGRLRAAASPAAPTSDRPRPRHRRRPPSAPRPQDPDFLAVRALCPLGTRGPVLHPRSEPGAPGSPADPASPFGFRGRRTRAAGQARRRGNPGRNTGSRAGNCCDLGNSRAARTARTGRRPGGWPIAQRPKKNKKKKKNRGRPAPGSQASLDDTSRGRRRPGCRPPTSAPASRAAPRLRRSGSAGAAEPRKGAPQSPQGRSSPSAARHSHGKRRPERGRAGNGAAGHERLGDGQVTVRRSARSSGCPIFDFAGIRLVPAAAGLP